MLERPGQDKILWPGRFQPTVQGEIIEAASRRLADAPHSFGCFCRVRQGDAAALLQPEQTLR